MGPTDNNNPAVFDLMYCSDQLIKEKGIKFPINPIKIIKIISFLVRLKVYFLYL